jgi:hypothetical protein
MTTPREALEALSFGSVDSESEADLDRKFLRTADFDSFLRPEIILIKGAKGSGKSALFELFTNFESAARTLAGHRLDDILIIRGTGFKDSKELTTDDMSRLQNQNGFDYERAWKLFIGLTIALQLDEKGIRSSLIRSVGKSHDYRILPILQRLWSMTLGGIPSLSKIAFPGGAIEFGGQAQRIHVSDLISDIDATLEKTGSSVWILFDKIDEIFPSDPAARKQALEGLFLCCLAMRSPKSRIHFKILLRTDLWNILNFTNKSHFVGKDILLSWSQTQLMSLMVKRASVNATVRYFLDGRVPELRTRDSQELPPDVQQKLFYTLFARKVYPGTREADVLGWIVERITDGLGSVYPREFITLGNIAGQNQRLAETTSEDGLIGGPSIRNAFTEVSDIRVATYLTEFPGLAAHFRRFNGQQTSLFSRQELIRLMDGLDPQGDEMIRRLYDVGILTPIPRGPGADASRFEIPRLYRTGLGLVLRGRP